MWIWQRVAIFPSFLASDKSESFIYGYKVRPTFLLLVIKKKKPSFFSACCPVSGVEHILYIKVPPGEWHIIKLIFLFTKTDLSSNLQFYLSIKVSRITEKKL